MKPTDFSCETKNHMNQFQSVSETATGGTSVLMIQATDNDAGNNAVLTYTVDDTIADLYFEVILNLNN